MNENNNVANAANRQLQQNEAVFVQEPGGNVVATLKDPLKIDDRLKKITDARPTECASKLFRATDKVSIIITFFDYQFYDLKMTIDSVRLHTPEQSIQEIIMVDDGSTLDYIKEDARLYAQKLSNAKLIRVEQREGKFVSFQHKTR